MASDSDSAGESHSQKPSKESRALSLGASVLAAVAYAPLLLPESFGDPVQGAEAWFFSPAESSSGLIVLLAAWLLYRRWNRLGGLPSVATPVVVSSLVFGIGIGLAVWASLTRAQDILILSLVANGIGLTLVFRGFAGLRLTGLPLGVLFLALPLPGVVFNAVVFQFQLWTAQWAGWLLLQMGVTAHVSGDLIIRPEDTFAIIEGCSGMRSVEALSLLAILLVDSFGRRGWHAVLIVALAPGVAFLMNGLRVLTLIFNPHSEIAEIHNLQGIVVLLGGLLVLAGTDSLLEKIIPSAADDPRGGKDGSIDRTPGERGNTRSKGRVAVAVLGVSALATLAPFPDYLPPRLPAVLNTHFSDPAIGWQKTDIPIDIPFMGKTRFRSSLHGRFQRQADEVELFVGVGERAQRAFSIRSPKTAFPGSGWVVEDRGTKWLAALDQAVEWRLLRSGTRRVMSYRWHRGADPFFSDALLDATALHSSPWRPRGGWDGMAVRITSSLEGPGDMGRQAAESRIDAFAVSIAPSLKVLEEKLRRNIFSQFTPPRKKSSTAS